jgi:glycosyltransferase involved in cell wall biosynthesis
MPLVISTLFGGLFSAIALFAIVFVIVRYLIWGDPVAGWASTICILLLIGGLQMLFTGILGQYISKIYMETKQRPIYIVRDSNTKKSN